MSVPETIEAFDAIDERHIVIVDLFAQLMLCDVEAGTVVSAGPTYIDANGVCEDAIEGYVLIGRERLVSARHDALELWNVRDLAQPLVSASRDGSRPRKVVLDGSRVIVECDDASEVWFVDMDARRLALVERVAGVPVPREDRSETPAFLEMFGCNSYVTLADDRIVSASHDETLVVWDLEGNAPIVDAKRFGSTRLAALSRDRFVVVDGDTIELWEISVAAQPPPRKVPRFRALHAAGTQFLAHSSGARVTMVDPRTGARVPRSPLDEDDDRYHIEVVYADDDVVLYNVQESLALLEWKGLRIGQADMGFDRRGAIAPRRPGGMLLARSLYDHRYVDLVALRSTPPPSRLGPHASSVVDTAFDGLRGDLVFAACADATVSVWSTGTGTLVRTFAATVAKRMLVSEQGWIVLVDEAGDVHTFDVAGTRHATIRGPFRNIQIGASGREILTANDGGGIASWNPVTGDLVAGYNAGEPITELTTSGNYVAWLDRRGEVQIIERDSI